MARGARVALASLLVALAAAAVLASCTTADDGVPTRSTSAALGWSAANPPIHIRSGHTTTLIGTGELFVAGGGSLPASTELVELASGRTVAGPALLAARTGHTATLLSTGKVLLAGGNGLRSAELYDPVARTTTATGAMAKVRASHVAVRLASGKVLVVGGAGDRSSELFDPGTATWSVVPDRGATNAAAATTLADGRVLVLSRDTPVLEIYDPAKPAAPWTPRGTSIPADGTTRTLTRVASGDVVASANVACQGNGSTSVCFSNVFTIALATQGETTSKVMPTGGDGYSAARLPDDVVIFPGGSNGVDSRTVSTFNPASGSTSTDGALASTYTTPTASVVPGGDVFVLGGSQASVDRRVATGTWRQGLSLTHGRLRHAAVRLHDGRVLVTGGSDPIVSQTPIVFAELLDASSGVTTPAPDMHAARQDHTMTALRDGRVLVAGGGSSSAELYTPGAGFVELPPMTASRAQHAAVLLSTGKVLLVGGDAAGSAELFDPSSSTFAALPAPRTTHDGSTKGAVLLPNGRVLVVGGAQAEIFEPLTATFRPVAPPGSPRDGTTARLLVSGKVFVAGGDALAAELFDPATETWSFTLPQPEQNIGERWAALPDGRLVGGSGRGRVEGTSSSARVYDPLGVTTGSFVATPNIGVSAYQRTFTLAGTGQVLASGGDGCFNVCFGPALHDVSVFGDDAVGSRPVITAVPDQVVAGTRVTITGTGFTGAGEASSGQTGSSPTNDPLAYWVSDANDGLVMGTILDFTDTSATWLVPATALHGHGQLFVGVAGVMSRGQSVSIAPALAATGCANDAQCAGGFCVDGVCCDRRCDGACEGCSAAHKLAGMDGVCGPVPPGKDIYGRCVLKLGDTCVEKDECGPNFCSRVPADGRSVCCDSACEGQCLSCNLPGHAGTCSAINEGACGAACDGAHTLKQVGNPDRDCAPFTCEANHCKTTCASVRDCAAPAVCSLAGQCEPPSPESAGDASVFGCASSPGRGSAGGVLGVGLGLAIAARRRRGRR